MSRVIKRTALLTISLLLFVSAASAQSPYPSFKFNRQPNELGTTTYVLKPLIAEVQKKVGGIDKPYQFVGVQAAPSIQMAGLLFVNGQKEVQFLPGTEINVTITADSVDVPVLATVTENMVMKLQIINVFISFSDFQRIAKADSVKLKLGPIAHLMDKDNLSAFRFVLSEIEKDVVKGP